MPAIIRTRIHGNVFSEEEKIGGGETDAEKVVRLENENVLNMLAMTDMFEANIKLSSDNTQLMLAVTDLYEMIIGGNV